jgi:hypothetical protein
VCRWQALGLLQLLLNEIPLASTFTLHSAAVDTIAVTDNEGSIRGKNLLLPIASPSSEPSRSENKYKLHITF